MKVRMIVDSTADLMPEVREKLTVVPLTIHFGHDEYVDGVTITHHQFYEKLVESDVMPTTSQPTPEAFADIFRQVEENGDQAVVLTISSKLSGTCQSATIAAADFPGRVWVVDSRSVAIGSGILAELGLQLAEQGMDAPSIATRLEQERDNVRVIAMLDTLEYLKKGGRISSAAAIAGGILSIKPVIAIQDGEICTLGKARGSKNGRNMLNQYVEKHGGIDYDMPLSLGYAGMDDKLLRKYILDSAHLWEGKVEKLPISQVGGTIGTHVGPGAIALGYFSPED